MYFWGGYTAQLRGCIPQEDGQDTAVGRSNSSSQTVGSLLTKSVFGAFNSMKKCNQLLLAKSKIQQALILTKNI
jgi:hypothetical protein